MLPELLLSITDAVFSYVIDKLDPAETIKSWLKREPARLAFQKALARAYSAFARQYPDYAASLFNQSFLEKEAAPELAKLLARGQHPDPAALAQLWGQSLDLEPLSEFCQRATKPAADFLAWLEAELKAEPVFQPLFDSRALDSLPKIEEGIEKLTAELTRNLDAALKQAGEYEKVVLSIGGNVPGSVVIGDNNQINVTKVYYSGQFASLNDYYISPDSVFQRVRVDEFVGREWLTAKVDAFLNDPSQKSGAFVLVGEAGVGKTSFMAHLVKERSYLHFFSEQAPGDSGLQRALQSLGSQLVTRYQIDPYKDRDTLTQTAVFPDFLERLMRIAAQGLCNGEKIVIVCDALDEAGTFPDGNVLGLPNVLPDGVYLILSQRPVNVKLPNLTPHIEKLEAQGEDNLQDMQIYLAAIANRPEIAGQIRAHGYSEAFFIETLKEKSQGVWMYLHYIIREIESGSRAPLDLENLPIGLVGYYADFWDDWRNGYRGRGEGPPKWDELYAPLLTALAAAQEPITIEQLIEWAGVAATPREVARLLSEVWRAFITERETPKGRLYFPYHLSFRDFITGKVNFEKLSVAQGNLVRDLAEQTVEAHQRIVQVFETACQGRWETLVEQDYPCLHLSAHLVGAGQYDQLTKILTEGDANIAWAEARYQKEETYAGYLSDLEFVWQHADNQTDLALLVRCVLIENSIRSLAERLPPVLIAELGKSGMWSLTRCLATIRQKSDEKEKAEALVLLAPQLDAPLISETLDITSDIRKEYCRANALAGFAQYLPNALLIRALDMAYEFDEKFHQADVLYALVPFLPDPLQTQTFSQALDAAREIEDENGRANALSRLAPYLQNELKSLVLSESLDTARKISNEFHRPQALVNLAIHMTDEGLKALVFQEVLDSVWQIENKDSSIKALCDLIPHLPEIFQVKALHTALGIVREIENGNDSNVHTTIHSKLETHITEEWLLDVLNRAREIKNENTRASILFLLALHITEGLLSNALDVACEIRNGDAFAFALSGLAPRLPETLLSKALDIAQKIDFEEYHSKALSTLIPYLSEVLNTQVLNAAPKIKDENLRARTLSSLAPYLPEVLKNQMLDLTRKIENENTRARALSDLSPYLPQGLKLEALSESLDAAREIKDEFAYAVVLSYLAPHLPESLFSDILNTVHNMGSKRAIAEALSSLAPNLPVNLFDDALGMVYEIQDEWEKVDALAGLAQYLPEELFSKALDVAHEIKRNEYQRARVITNLAPYFPEALKAQALDIACKIWEEYHRAFAICGLAPYLPDTLKAQALDTVRGIKNGYDYWAYAFSYLTQDIPEAIKIQDFTQALLTVRGIRDEDHRAGALRILAQYLPEVLRDQALDIARGIGDEYACAIALLNLAVYLSDDLKSGVVAETLIAVSGIKDAYHCAHALSGLAPYLSETLFLKALNVAQNIKDEHHRADALSGLAPYLPETLINQALDIACDIKDKYSHAHALSSLVPHLPEILLPKALGAARRIQNKDARAIVLTALIPRQPDILQEALDTTIEIVNDHERARVLSKLVSYVDQNNRPSILGEILLLLHGDLFDRQILTELLPQWKEIQYTGLRQKITIFLRQVAKENRRDGLEVIGIIADALSSISGRNIAPELYRAITDVTHWWP